MPVSLQRKVLRSLAFRFPVVRRAANSSVRYWAYFWLRRVHDEDFRAFTGLSRRRPMLYLDVGANQGMSALAIYTVDPDARVLSFEPNPAHARHLDRIARRFSSFSWRPYGLSDASSTAPLFVPSYRGVEISGLASFDRDAAFGWLDADRIFGFDRTELTVEESVLELRRLDDLDLAPDVIKLDVQGFEKNVIDGGIDTVRTHLPVLLVEDVEPGSDLAALLTDRLGYRPFTMVDDVLVEGLRPARNSFFLHGDRLRSPRPSTGRLVELLD